MSETLGPDNKLRHWDHLSVTDPRHTKQFQRPGGFKGTAIRPVWNQYRLTMHFGPFGIGWGTEKPDFSVHEAGEEMLVFCTLKCWYMDDAGVRAEIYGVGGDKIMTKTQRGISTDDEAFKKAFTDALGNAFVKVGLSADVHMGLFEDSKYLQWASEQSERRPEVDPSSLPPQGDDAPARSRQIPRRQTAAEPGAEQQEAKQRVRELMDAIDATEDAEMLLRFAEWPQLSTLDELLRRAVTPAAQTETIAMLSARAAKRREAVIGSLKPFDLG